MDILVLALLVWLPGSLAVGFAAETRGRGFWAWVGLAILSSPLLGAVLLLAYPIQFEPDGLYKGVPYRSADGRIQAMLPGGIVTFRNSEDLNNAIDGETGYWRKGNSPLQPTSTKT